MLLEIDAAAAFARTMARAATLSTRERIVHHQRRQSARLTADARKAIPFYQSTRASFDGLPIIDKAIQQSRFAEFNALGVTVAEIVAALDSGRETVRDHFVGQSTGTSGNRSRFVISPRERLTWLGTIVAKALPDALFRRRRVALALPGLSALYRSAASASRIQLAFFDLARGVHAWRDELIRFAPEVLVAPPKVLRLLAESGALADVQAFSGAEVLDPLDRGVIERATGRTVREIYMATEGLFGVACRHGTLHLAEDVMRFEWEPVPGTVLVMPIVTDLVRRVQPMIRYRMNDLLELSDRPCSCGSAFQAVARVHGRMDDVFEFEGPAGSLIATPDILRNAVVDTDPRILDFRVTQKLDGHIIVSLNAALPLDVHEAARASVERVLRRLGAAPVVQSVCGIPPLVDRKLRRVERERL